MRSVMFKKLILGGLLSIAAIGFIGVIGTMTGGSAQAQEAASAESRQFSAEAGQIVSDANDLLSADQYGAAIAKLQDAIGLDDLTPYERSIIYRMIGAAYYQMDNPAEAIQNFERAIHSGGLLPDEDSTLEVNIAQMMVGAGRYAEGAQRIEEWYRRGGVMTDSLIKTVMQAWIQAENYDRALPWAERWFADLPSKSEQDFNTMNFLYYEVKSPEKQADIVKQMVVRWPDKKKYWDALTSMLASSGREKDAFEVRKMLYLGGVLSDERDLLQIVQYYSFYEMPYQAADILEREMEAGRITKSADRLLQLSNLWRQAREYKRAIPILEQATAQAGTAVSYAGLGEAYYNEKQCEQAEQAFNQAVSRGYDAGTAQMLIGTCYYEQSQKENRLSCTMSQSQMSAAARVKFRNKSRRAFNQVPGSSSESRNAKQWINFIASEEKSFTDRCGYSAKIGPEQCYIAIRAGYKNKIFTGGKLVVSDACSPYVEAYDKEFRSTSKSAVSSED